MNQEKLAVRIVVSTLIISGALAVMIAVSTINTEAEERPLISSLTTATERRTVETKRTETKRVAQTTQVETSTTHEVVEETQVHETKVETFKVAGKAMDESLQRFLYDELSSYGCAWWFPYAICQAYQESNFQTDCISAHSGENNDDCGLFQFKQKWWNWYASEAGVQGDIMNPYTQIEVYAFHVCGWLNEGASVEQALSNWYTGGQGYSQEYVNDVLRWTERLER